MKKPSLTALLPYWHLSPEGIMFNRNGLLEFGLSFSLPGTVFLNDSVLDSLTSRLMLLLRNNAPLSHRTRLILEASHDPSTIPSSYVHAILNAPDDSPERRIAELRLHHFENRLREGSLRTWRLHLTQTLTPPRGKLPNTQYSSREYEDAISAAIELRAIFETHIRAMGLTTTPLEFDGVFNLAYNYLNPDPSNRPDSFTEGTIREQLVRSTVDNHFNNKIKVGDTWITGIRYSRTPSELVLGAPSTFLPEEGSAYVIIDLVHVPPGQSNASLDLELERISKLNEEIKSPANVAKIEEVSDALKRMTAYGEHLFNSNVFVVVTAKSLDELSHKRISVKSNVGLASGGAANEHFGHFMNWWLSAAPLAGTNLPDEHKLLDGDARYLLPVRSPWQGSSNPVYLVETREKTVAGLNPFDTATKNNNALVIGGSGSGKSFAVQSLVSAALIEDPLVVIIEKGDGYANMVDSLDGVTIILEPTASNPVSINPFDLEEGMSEPDSEKMARLVNVIRAMLGDSKRNPAIETSLIQAAINHVYRRAYTEEYDPNTGQLIKSLKTPTLSDFVNSLNNVDTQISGDPLSDELRAEASKIAMELGGWIGKAPFANIVDRPTNIDVNSRIVYFNLQSLTDYPELLRVGVLLISEIVWQRILKVPERKKMIVFDEVWDLLRHDASRSFIESLFRTVRKYGGAAIAVTQSLSEIHEHMTGVVTSVNNFLLFQMPGEEVLAQKLLDAPDAVLEAHKSVTTVPGRYSELLYAERRGDGMHGSIIRIPPTQHEYWLFSTSPNDRNTLSLYRRVYGDPISAINAIIADGITPTLPLPDEKRVYLERLLTEKEDGRSEVA